MPPSKRLVTALTSAARRAFTEARDAHPGERFYVFALFSETGDDLQPTCHSEEALARVVARHATQTSQPSPSQDELRYFAEEFEYHQSGEEHFAPVAKITKTPGKDDGAAAVAALQTLDREGFFGRGKARRDVAVLVLTSDPSHARIIEHASALNPKAVVESLRRFFPVREASAHASSTIGKERVYAIDELALSRDGRVLAAAGAFGNDGVFVWRLDATPKLLLRDKVVGDLVWSAALTCDGALLFGRGKTSILRWDVRSKKPLPHFEVRGDSLRAIALSPNDDVLVYASYQSLPVAPWAEHHTLALLDASTGAELAITEAEASFVGFSPDGSLLAFCGKAAGTATAPQGIDLLDARSLTSVRLLSDGGKRFWCFAFSPDGHCVAGVIEGDGAGIAIFDARDGTIRRRIDDYAGRARRLAFSPDGVHVAAALDSGRLRVWNVATGASVLDVRTKHENLSTAVFLDERRVAAGGCDPDNGPPVTIWELSEDAD